MARPCATCEHLDRPQIERGLANGVSLRVLTARYGLDRSQLSRHRVNHMDDALMAQLRVRGSRSDEELAKLRDVESKSLLDHLGWQRAKLYRVADQAHALGAFPEEIKAIAEAGRASERIAKLLGDMPTGSTHVTVNLVQSPEYHRLRSLLLQALRPFPDSWAAASTALRQLENEGAPALEHAA